MELQIPETTISLRQGVGLLIRDVSDRGIVVLRDNRLNSKSYGKGMLESLPEMARATNMDTVKVFASSLNTK